LDRRNKQAAASGVLAAIIIRTLLLKVRKWKCKKSNKACR
jgi:hypothetical protein